MIGEPLPNVCDVCHKSLAAHLELGDMTFHNDLTQHLCVGLHLYVAHVSLSCVDILCYISYTRYFQQTILLIGIDAESSVIRLTSTTLANGIGWACSSVTLPLMLCAVEAIATRHIIENRISLFISFTSFCPQNK